MTGTDRPAGTGRSPSFPRRDASGRIVSAPEFFGGVLFAILLGTVILVAIDGIFSVLGAGRFGHLSGWLAGILAAWTFVEEFRAWRGVPGRIGVALVAIAIALLAGSTVTRLFPYLLPVFAGAIGVTVAALVYAALWFFGIRWLAGRVGER